MTGLTLVDLLALTLGVAVASLLWLNVLAPAGRRAGETRRRRLR